jgi:hypothetical protein
MFHHVCMFCDSKYVIKDVECYNSSSLLPPCNKEAHTSSMSLITRHIISEVYLSNPWVCYAPRCIDIF